MEQLHVSPYILFKANCSKVYFFLRYYIFYRKLHYKFPPNSLRYKTAELED